MSYTSVQPRSAASNSFIVRRRGFRGIPVCRPKLPEVLARCSRVVSNGMDDPQNQQLWTTCIMLWMCTFNGVPNDQSTRLRC